jgi:hypothetical protein
LEHRYFLQECGDGSGDGEDDIAEAAALDVLVRRRDLGERIGSADGDRQPAFTGQLRQHGLALPAMLFWNAEALDEAQIGTGFRPETQQSRRYDFPSPDQPLLEFLDTRGLGEAGYDPQEDIAAFDATAHLLLVTARAGDHAQQAVVEPLRAIRKAKRDRPVILVLTALHDLYPQEDHPQPDPMGFAPADVWDRQRMPPALTRSLDEQVRRFAGLVDYVVPVDLTLPEDGFNDPAFGSQRLKEATPEHEAAKI